jgi:type I restriction enzyme R subunit
MAKLAAATIYYEAEVDALAADYLAHKGNNALMKWVTPARDRFRDRERTADDANDKAALDELIMFRKDVGTFLRQYDFLSQIVNYEDLALEKLSIYLRHLAPVITVEQLQHEIDLSMVDFDYIAQHEQGTTSGKRLFDFDRAISMKSGLRPAGCGCSGIVSGGLSCLGSGIRTRRV